MADMFSQRDEPESSRRKLPGSLWAIKHGATTEATWSRFGCAPCRCRRRRNKSHTQVASDGRVNERGKFGGLKIRQFAPVVGTNSLDGKPQRPVGYLRSDGTGRRDFKMKPFARHELRWTVGCYQHRSRRTPRADFVEKLGVFPEPVNFAEHLPAGAPIHKQYLPRRAFREPCSGF